MPPPPRKPQPPAPRSGRPAPRGLADAEIDELQDRLDAVPAPLEALDTSSLDGFLCGVLLQPEAVPIRRWLPFVTDVDGRPLPAGFDARRLVELVERRHRELDAAIARRQWFDPWVFELEAAGDDAPAGDDADDTPPPDDEDAPPPAVDAVYPWVAGFATALELFPALMRCDAAALTPPLALVFRHLDADDLEDADDLLAEIDSLEPPADLAEAVEGLVRATLLLADVARPVRRPPGRR